MHPNARSLIAVLVAGFITQIIGHSSPWWAFLLILGFVFMVVDAALEALAERRRK